MTQHALDTDDATMDIKLFEKDTMVFIVDSRKKREVLDDERAEPLVLFADVKTFIGFSAFARLLQMSLCSTHRADARHELDSDQTRAGHQAALMMWYHTLKAAAPKDSEPLSVV